MTVEELINNQHSWSVFFNEPITKEQVNDTILGFSYSAITYIGEANSANSKDTSWHTVSFSDLKEFNKLRAAILLESFRAEIRVTEGKRAYLDVYHG